jgi:hypothetical protein
MSCASCTEEVIVEQQQVESFLAEHDYFWCEKQHARIRVTLCLQLQTTKPKQIRGSRGSIDNYFWQYCRSHKCQQGTALVTLRIRKLPVAQAQPQPQAADRAA